jgi:hypothetical protein
MTSNKIKQTREKVSSPYISISSPLLAENVATSMLQPIKDGAMRVAKSRHTNMPPKNSIVFAI